MKTKNILIFFGIVLGIVLLFGGGLYLFSPNTLAVTPIGCSGTVESIDSMIMRTSNELGGKKVIRVKYSTLPTSECLDITLSESQIKDNLMTTEGFEVTNGIRGNVQLQYQKKESTINKKTEKYLKFQTTEITGTLLCLRSSCENKGVSGTFKSFTEGGKCFCVTDEQVGNKATFTSSGNLVWSTLVTIGGQETVLSNEKLSGKIGDIAFVKWVGNVQSNYFLTGVFQESYFHLADNKFRMVELGAYQEVEAERKRVRGRLEDCIFCRDEIVEMRAYNSFLISKTRDRINAWANEELGVDSAKIFSNRLVIDVGKNTLVYPAFILDIDAKEVGVFISQGKPEAICPDDFSINSGDRFRAQATAKNIGVSSGSFTWWVECDKGSQSVYPGPPLTIGSKSSRTISINSGLTVGEGTETARCIFTVRELNTLEEDSCQFKYDSTKVTKCTSGVKSCENGNQDLWTCLPDGNYDKVRCDFGCESFGNSFRCGLQSKEICDNGIDDDGDGLIDSEDPECKPKGLSNWLYIIPVFLTLGLAGLFGVRGRIRRGKFKWFDFVIGGILGLGVGLLIFYFLRWIIELKVWNLFG